jgi:transcriptional regulator with XRE-family HTH domain
MDEESRLPRDLAENIEALRTARGLSQAALARLAGVPRSTLTHVESGHGNPSLANLARIAASLSVSIEELLTRPRAACKLTRASELPAVRRAGGAATLFKLLPDPIPGMEIDRMSLDAGARMGGVPHVRGTKEYLTVIQGEIHVYVAGQRFGVGVGDVLAFPGDQTHSYHNTGRGRALALSVVALAPPGV